MMRTSHRIALAAVFAAAVCFGGGRPIVHGQGAGDALAIIVHRGNPIDMLSSAELRRIFMLETQTWPHGRRITVVLRDKSQPERESAIRAICGLSEADYERHVLLQTFRGTVTRGPRSIQSASQMLRFIFNTPGAIGYVRADEVDNSVKVMAIDNLLPGDAQYPLQRGARIGKVSWPLW